MNIRKTAVVSCMVIITTMVIGSMAQASECLGERNEKPIRTPSKDFILHDNGLVTHMRTGLMWMRCSLGQQWDGASCQGEATELTWDEAMRAGNDLVIDGMKGWHLPSIGQLGTIAEPSCWGASINAEIFPNTPQDWYWTSTERGEAKNRALIVSFAHATHIGTAKIVSYRVRLVRIADPEQ